MAVIILSSVLLWMLSFFRGVLPPAATPGAPAPTPPVAIRAGVLHTQFTAVVRGSRAPPVASA